MATPDRVPPRYCIIGAGYAGLAAAKGFTDAGLDYDQLEAKEQIGGNWFDGVYDSTTMISSKDATAYADHPMPADYPMFPSRAQMLAYLQGYAARFGLDRRIRLNTLVESVTPRDPTGLGGWTVRLASGEEREYAGAVVANGHYWKVNIPEYPGEFTGKQLHSKFYTSRARGCWSSAPATRVAISLSSRPTPSGARTCPCARATGSCRRRCGASRSRRSTPSTSPCGCSASPARWRSG
jgi:cation diffusion facilitator CzcD-associated flavoprotein CzcO